MNALLPTSAGRGLPRYFAGIHSAPDWVRDALKANTPYLLAQAGINNASWRVVDRTLEVRDWHGDLLLRARLGGIVERT